MDLAHIRLLNSGLLNKDLDVVLEQASLLILNGKLAISMS